MTATKPLPANPSLEFERKQAKALENAVNEGDRGALARVRAQNSKIQPPLSRRDAQFVIAREYGFENWTALRDAFIEKSNGRWAADRAQRAIADNDLEQLKVLIAERPELLRWRDRDTDEVLLSATTSYANFPGVDEEDTWNRRECAEVLLDAGALTDPRVVLRIIDTGARKMLELFRNRGVAPENYPSLQQPVTSLQLLTRSTVIDFWILLVHR